MNRSGLVLAALCLLACSSTDPLSGGSAGAAGAGGSAGSSGNAGSGGGGGSSGASCQDAACSASQICVAYRTIGGAVNQPNDAGACPIGTHLEHSGGTLDWCNADFRYQCSTATSCVGAVNCACGASACPTSYGSCSEVTSLAGYVDPSAALVCQLLAP